MTENPKVLLDEPSGLRMRARADRHGYWFPLLLFGVLTFASLPLYRIRDLAAGEVFVHAGSGWKVFGVFIDPFRV